MEDLIKCDGERKRIVSSIERNTTGLAWSEGLLEGLLASNLGKCLDSATWYVAFGSSLVKQSVSVVAVMWPGILAGGLQGGSSQPYTHLAPSLSCLHGK